MGFSVDPEFYDVSVTDDEQGEEVLREYMRYRFDEGMTMQDAAQRMGVDVRDAAIMEHKVLRLGRPAL